MFMFQNPIAIDDQVKSIVERTGMTPCDVRKMLLAQMGLTLQQLPQIDPTVRCVTSSGMVIGQPG